MSMQVIWKIKHQNLNFQGKKIYAHKSYYQLMGFVQIPTDLFTKFTPWCLDSISCEVSLCTHSQCWLYPQHVKCPASVISTGGWQTHQHVCLTSTFSLKFFQLLLNVSSSLALLSLCCPLSIFSFSSSLPFLIPSSPLPLSLLTVLPFPPSQSWMWGRGWQEA